MSTPKRRPRFRLLIALLLLSVAMQLTRSEATDVTARQIMDRLYMSNGQPIQDLMIQAEVSKLKGDPAPGNLHLASRDKLFFKRPNKLRDDAVLSIPGTLLDGTMRTVIRDGANAWEYISQSPKPIKTATDPPHGSVLIPYFLQRYPQDADKDYVLVGRQTMDGVAAEVIRISSPYVPQDVMTVWVDTRRWVPLKTEHWSIPKGAKKPSVLGVMYRNIRPVADGRNFPLGLEIYQDDVLTTVIVYKAVSVNTGLQDTLFEPMAKFQPPPDAP